jgi:hypothetical protein
MRHCISILAVLLLAHGVAVGLNPDLRVFLDFDPPNAVTRIDPVPGTPFNVYILTDCFSPGGGLRGLAVAFERTFGGICGGEINLLGGAIHFGDIEDPYLGWLPTAGEDCVHPDATGVVAVGYVQYYYTGPPGYIRVIWTEAEPGKSLDCNFVEDCCWCVAGNAGVNMDAPQGDPTCNCGPTTVNDATWGIVKALYR